MRLLIVEDNLRLALLLADGLQRRGFACDTANSLAEAESALASRPTTGALKHQFDGRPVLWRMAPWMKRP